MVIQPWQWKKKIVDIRVQVRAYILPLWKHDRDIIIYRSWKYVFETRAYAF